MKLRKLPKTITIKTKEKEITMDILEAIEYFYSIGYTDRAVAGAIGYSFSRWSEILNASVKRGIVKEVQKAKERGIAKHQQRIISKIESIISQEKFNDVEFLLRYLRSKYPNDYENENTKITVEFISPKKGEKGEKENES